MRRETAIWRGVFGLLAVLLIWAFLAAGFFQNSGILSLTPPATWENPDPAPDVAPGDALALYQAAFTAWVSLILLVPAYIAVWFARLKTVHYTTWLSFWTAAYFAYLVHLYVSGMIFFKGDLEAMLNTSRVTAFWPGMAIVFLWGLDIVLGLRQRTGIVVTLYRAVVHVLVFILFLGGSLFMGELTLVKMLGVALLAAVVTGSTVWLREKTRRPRA